MEETLEPPCSSESGSGLQGSADPGQASGSAPREAAIAFMDSGIGGLPYLRRVRELLPLESFLYLADTEGFPYGEKDEGTIRRIVLDRVGRLVRFHAPKALVIACNTASQIALHAVRQAHPGLPVIGTVPAVKPAAETSLKHRIAVLATLRTVRDPYLDQLIQKYAPGCAVLRAGAPDLVGFVERDYLSAGVSERRAAVAPYVSALVGAGADRIVLACTHFLHVAADIEALAREIDPEARTVDSREGVAHRLVQVLRERGLARVATQAEGECRAQEWRRATDVCPSGLLLLSGRTGDTAAYAEWARRFGLSGPELLGS